MVRQRDENGTRLFEQQQRLAQMLSQVQQESSQVEVKIVFLFFILSLSPSISLYQSLSPDGVGARHEAHRTLFFAVAVPGGAGAAQRKRGDSG